MPTLEDTIPGQLDAIREQIRAGDEGRAEITRKVDAINIRLTKGDGRMEQIEGSIHENTAKTMEVLDLLNTFKGGMKFLGWLGVGAKWIAAMVAAGAAIWTAIQTFLPHK